MNSHFLEKELLEESGVSRNTELEEDFKEPQTDIIKVRLSTQ